MLSKTKGIVLKVTNYAESSIISQIFTEQFGLQSYIVNNVRGKKPKQNPSLFQPLNQLVMVVYHQPNGGIQRISEIKNDPPYQSIPYQINKSSVALFLNEILYKTLRHQQADEKIFNFIINSLEVFDHTESSTKHFHLHFLSQLTRYLGFFPEGNQSMETPYFDLKSGCYVSTILELQLVMDMKEAALLYHYTKQPLTNPNHEAIQQASKQLRKDFLHKLVLFYQLHTDDFGTVNSLEVLEAVFGD